MRLCAVWGPRVRVRADGESHLRPPHAHSWWPLAVFPAAPSGLLFGDPRDPTSPH